MDLDFVLIDLNPYTILRRRMDSSKKRKLEFEHIYRELEKNRQYFKEYCNHLGIGGNIFINDNLKETSENLRRVIL